MASTSSPDPLAPVPPTAIDLTTDSAPPSPKDHMSTVAAMVRSEPITLASHRQRKPKRKDSEKSHAATASISTPPPAQRRRGKSSSTARDKAPPPPANSSKIDTIELSSDDHDDHDADDDVQISSSTSVPKRPLGDKDEGKRRGKFHRFLELPPEIRNRVYEILLTTPGVPIEFPRLTGAEGRRRAKAWSECTTPATRRAHKTIFLEILQTSRQLHYDALPLIYSLNTFKYRCTLAARALSPILDRQITPPPPTPITLPTRHLGLVKHIKVAIIVEQRRNVGPGVWAVAGVGGAEWSVNWATAGGMVEQFAREGMELETFELSCFSFIPTTLSPQNAAAPLHAALLKIRASRSFRALVLGEAKVAPEMVKELEEGVRKAGEQGGNGGVVVEVRGGVDYGVAHVQEG